MRGHIVDEFPRGIQVLNGLNSETGIPDVPTGVLSIVVGADLDGFAESIAFFPLHHGSILAIRSDEPTHDIGVPIITAADVASPEHVLNTAS
jgi:hypothetical protein